MVALFGCWLCALCWVLCAVGALGAGTGRAGADTGAVSAGKHAMGAEGWSHKELREASERLGTGTITSHFTGNNV